MLTPTKQKVLKFINTYTDKKGYSPTLEEIRNGLRLNSISTIHQHIKELENSGHLNKKSKLHRSIEIPKHEGMIKISLLGTISAGEPIEAVQEREIIAVPKSKVDGAGEVYALRVQGDSMIDEGVNDGDTILIRKQNTAENGQKVVALLNGYEATLKTFYKENGRIRLQPANKNYQPIIIKNKQDISIQGILFDIIKSGEVNEPSTSINSLTKKKSEKTDPYFEALGFTLYQGDCLDILKQIPEESVDMIFADPPYNLSNGGFSVHAGRMVSVNKGGWDKSKGFKDDYEFHHKWLEACRRVLKPEGTLWLSGTYHSIYQCGHALQALDFHILNDISWFKPNASPNLSCRFFTASHETLIWARKEKKSKHFFNYNLMKNGDWIEDSIKKPGLQMRSVWSIHPPQKWEKTFGKHPTQKPIALLKRVLLSSTKPDAIILDPFTGSSTTGIAAKIIGKRKFIGIDMDKSYLDLSIKRLGELKQS
ncbi:MAG: methylase protein [Parcubacteria group bacterium GW2011_GWB1_49_7]|nr:MAG: methylase protein [Parcubacteria group bacterium GW2011_GWA1_47_10]KKW09872.1 MAG: methylase protein [Parcubacteria group bacterium GW2011_GWB1_49_7]